MPIPRSWNTTACLCAGLFLLVCLPTLGLNRLLDSDELTHAQAALEAARDGHWLPLTLHGQPWMEKPPLLPWLGALSLKIFGVKEWALRLWPCLAGAACLFFASLLASALAGQWLAGAAAALLLASQPDFLLHARFFSMDTALLACFFAAAFFIWRSGQPHQMGLSKRKLWRAGICLGLAAAIKSWFALAWLPAFILAWWWQGDTKKGFQDLAWRVVLVPLAILLLWLGLYRLAYGPSFVNQEWHNNLAGRFAAAPAELPNWLFYFYWFKEASPSLAFFGLPALFYAQVSKPKQPWALGWLARFVLAFCGLWLLGLLLVQRPVLNYPLPLTGFACLAWGWWLAEACSYQSCAGFFLCGLLFAGWSWNWSWCQGWVLGGGLVFSGLLILVQPRPQLAWRWGPLLKWSGVALLALAFLPNAQSYLLHPPDPNRAVVDVLLSHPAQKQGQVLLYQGHGTQALQFYSSYQIVPYGFMPLNPGAQSMLIENQQGVRFIPLGN